MSDPSDSTLTSFGRATPNTLVGNYRLLQRVGEGGMGEVWEAEQEKPVRRRVALKLIKWGMDTARVIARFEAERQALALMNHPNIAKVLDGGATPAGRPYFAMEYIKGLPITEYCDRHRLTTEQRLRLFALVCDGLQHAHHRGVIHRDIKPSNVLVVEEAGHPTPKIIDFGVAKATGQRLTEHTVFTEIGQLIGTPEYMSPEQIDPTQEDIDTRSDVYSMGVLLYELLVGVSPFGAAELREAGLEEIRRRIREEDPPTPSRRLSTAGSAAAQVGRNRSTEPGTLLRQLRKDLDWITLKAMSKERTRRYSSAKELQEDVERFLQDRPVVARPTSVMYRLRKFVRRNSPSGKAISVAAVAACALVAMLVLGRYVYLARHRFIEPREQLSWKGREPPFARLVIFRGSPARWWVDSVLGFPQFEYETDYDLEQLAPDRWADVRTGLDFSSYEDMKKALFERMKPEQQIRHLVYDGKIAEASERYIALAEDKLSWLTKVTGNQDTQDIIEFMTLSLPNGNPRPKDIEWLATWPSFRNRYFVLEACWRRNFNFNDDVLEILKDDPERIGSVRGAFGCIDHRIADPLTKLVPLVEALPLLNVVGDCDRVRQVRELPLADRDQDAMSYLLRCGALDVDFLRNLTPDDFWLSEWLNTAHAMGGEGLVSDLLRRAAPTRVEFDSKEAFDHEGAIPVLRSQLSSDDSEVQLRAAATLARHGLLDGLPILIEQLREAKQDPDASDFGLNALPWVRSEEILESLLTGGFDKRSSRMVSKALKPYLDDERVPVELVRMLRDEELGWSTYRGLWGLGLQDVKRLEAAAGKGPESANTYLLRLKQEAGGQIHEADLRAAVTTDRSYGETREAVIGLRWFYREASPTTLLQALRDPRREVRYAAVLALCEREDRTSIAPLVEELRQEAGPEADSARRALWAVRIADDVRAAHDEAVRMADDQRMIERAKHWMNTIDADLVTRELGRRHARPGERGLRPRELFLEPLFETHSISKMRLFESHQFPRALLDIPWSEAARGVLTKDPAFADYQRLHAVRVSFGLADPIEVLDSKSAAATSP